MTGNQELLMSGFHSYDMSGSSLILWRESLRDEIIKSTV